MDISAFDVYIVMQIDSIKAMMFFSSLIGSLVVVIFIPVFFDIAKEKQSSVFFVLPVLSIAILVFLGAVSAFIPSGSTLAAMKIIPSVAKNNFICNTIPQDTKAVYSMAIDAITRTLKESENK